MKEITGEKKENKIELRFSGRIDSNNAASVEEAVNEIIGDSKVLPIEIDMEELEYISSAGLRVLLRVRKNTSDMKLFNVNSEVYEILDMTGFTQMMDVEKAYRVVSVEGCEEIGRGANGTIYRIDMDNVVKVYNNADALEEIQHEREVARTALVLGIPTAISYDVVRVGNSYGSVFELLNAQSFSKILSTQPEKMDWCVHEYVELLKKIHETLVPKGQLPDIRETVIGWGRFMQDHLPKEAGDKLVALLEAVPQDDHMIHGDYHTKNVELVGDEVLLIDMDTLAVGHPIFELASMFNAYIGFTECDHEIIKKFQGFDFETSQTFWNKVLKEYLGTSDEEKIRAVEDKARIVGYTRLIRRSIRRGGIGDPARKAEIDHWTGELLELLERTDSLLFSSDEITVEADTKNLTKVTGFVNEKLKKNNCSLKTRMQIGIAVEEIFVNIANYAYKPGRGDATVRVAYDEDAMTATLTFIDSGIPYDPLKKEDPDVTLSAEERQIGGLGIFMTKKIMDEMSYEYKDGKNVLTLKKFLS